MAEASDKTQIRRQHFVAGIEDLGDDLLLNILSRLPALHFASAACVSRSWSYLCNRILSSSPKLSSAASFNHSLENAVNEVVDKVLSEPIRPQFALASIGPHFSLQATIQRIDAKLGSRIPLIVNVSEGIIGKDVGTDQFVEVQWEITEDQEDHGAISQEQTVNRGIILTVGFFPGLKARIVPFLYPNKGQRILHFDQFVMHIREAASSLSDSTSPAGIMVFADRKTDVKTLLQKIEYAFPEDMFVVGDGYSKFLYRSNNTNTRQPDSACAAVALIFARDVNKPLGIGETEFHVMLSTGVSPAGPTYRTASAKCSRKTTWLTAIRETAPEPLDGESILQEIYDELGYHSQYPAFYIGVTKRRKCSVGKERSRRMQFLEFHEVLGGDEQYLYVNSPGIATAEPFRFYVSDSKAALSSLEKVSDEFSHLKLDCDSSNNQINNRGRRKVFGGIIFSCCGRGEPFFRQAGADSAPFLNNFPGVSFGGSYCAGEIRRGKSSLYGQEDAEEEGNLVSCNEHVYASAYLVMSYCPPQPE